MNRSEQFERMLKLALSPEAGPSKALHEKIKKQIRERDDEAIKK